MQEFNKEDAGDQSTGKYVIHIDNFDGPLDLLWNLIREAKIDITEVSLSRITEQYIEYLQIMEKLNIQVASDFILMASELVYYKSRALLPTGELEDEYFVPPLPPELIEKLLEYKKYQEASRRLWKVFELREGSFPRTSVSQDLYQEEELIDVTLYDLLKAFAGVIDSAKIIDQQEIIFDEILVSDKIIHITGMLKTRDQIPFWEIFSATPSRPELIATFLAILEMTKTGKIRLMQHRIYGEIRLIRAFDV